MVLEISCATLLEALEMDLENYQKFGNTHLSAKATNIECVELHIGYYN